jgi:hypothetical protein
LLVTRALVLGNQSQSSLLGVNRVWLASGLSSSLLAAPSARQSLIATVPRVSLGGLRNDSIASVDNRPKSIFRRVFLSVVVAMLDVGGPWPSSHLFLLVCGGYA